MSSTNRRAALERAEAERQRRIDEKVERGEVVRVPLIVIGGVGSDLDVGAEKARKLADLQKGGERREVIFDPIEIIFTGVPRPSESDDTGNEPEPARRDEGPRNLVQMPQTPQLPEPEPPESAPRSIRIQIRPGNGADDAGEIAEGTFTVKGNELRLHLGRKTYTEWLRPADDPEAVARRLLRLHCGRSGFNGPLRHWPRGIV